MTKTEIARIKRAAAKAGLKRAKSAKEAQEKLRAAWKERYWADRSQNNEWREQVKKREAQRAQKNQDEIEKRRQLQKEIRQIRWCA